MSSFARSYSRAVLDAAPSGYDVGRFLSDTDAVRAALARDARLKAFFSSPAIPLPVKEKALDDLARRAGLDPFAARFLRLVLEHRRVLRLPEILAGVREEWDRRRGVLEARVTVAAPIGTEDERRIAERLSTALGKSVRIRTEVDPRILAGFVARVGSEVFDGSTLRAIEAFSEQVKETAGA